MFTACRIFSIPLPHLIVGHGASIGTALSLSLFSICAGVRSGSIPIRVAALATTNGAAIEVPDIRPYPLSLYVLYISSPGAMISSELPKFE